MIIITTPRNTAIYPVKPDGGNYTQCIVSDAEFSHWGILRFVPNEAGEYEGTLVEKTSGLLINWQPHEVTFTAEGITHVDVFIRKKDDIDWIQVGQNEELTGEYPYTVNFKLLQSDISDFRMTGNTTVVQPDTPTVTIGVPITVQAETDIPEGDLHIEVHNITQDTWHDFGTAPIQEDGGFFINTNITLPEANFADGDNIDIVVSRQLTDGTKVIEDSFNTSAEEAVITLNLPDSDVQLDTDIQVQANTNLPDGTNLTVQVKKPADSEWTDKGIFAVSGGEIDVNI